MGTEGCTLLLIGGDEEFQEGLRSHCRGWEFRLEEARTGSEGLIKARLLRPQTALVDLVLPDMDGREVLRRIRSGAPPTPVIVLSTFGHCRLVVEVMRLGAWDFLTKPVNWEQMRESVRGATAFGRGELASGKRPDWPAEADEGEEGVWTGEKMRRISRLVDQLANTSATVLIRGETGVGKELVAKALHRRSWRRGKPWARVNCAALPGELVESELFGFERGAFTGAHRRKPGRFEQVHGGTIFLDEIGEMPLSTQGKLLHVLQDGQFTPLGGTQSLRVDVRVIASTNQDLERAVEAGTLRKDLYYRLNVVTLWIPPLRERRDEIPVLAKYLLEKFDRLYDFPGGRGIPAALMEGFLTYDWPGNVRELENVIKRIAVLGEEAGVVGDLVQHPVLETSAGGSGPGDGLISLKHVARRAAMDAEKAMMQEVLGEVQWNRVKAARRLGISYKALLYKMRACGISHNPGGGKKEISDLR